MNAGGPAPQTPRRRIMHVTSQGKKSHNFLIFADPVGFYLQVMLKNAKNISVVTSWTQNLDKSGEGLT